MSSCNIILPYGYIYMYIATVNIVTMSARAYGWRYQRGSRARLSRQFSQHLYINYHFNNIQNKRILGRL